MRRLFSIPTLLCALAITVAACGSDSTSPAGSAAGNYTAISFTTSGSSGQTNQIALGGSLLLNLASNGAASGHLHVAASGSDPAFDADMAGTWTQNGNVVTISQSADTFVRDMPFTLTLDPANGWTLVGDKTFSGTNITITLKRVG
jgi:hypothetical protein